LHEYIVRHYKRLDKGARAFADKIFDEFDASINNKIDSLPAGRERQVLSRKLSMVRGERSSVPVLYLDTPVIENLVRYGLGQLSQASENAKAIYDEMRVMVKDGKLVCPENTFHREALQMGGAQARKGMEILRGFSEGLSFRHHQTIEDFQVFRAIRGFINGGEPIEYRSFWKDAFQKRTVNAILNKRPSVGFNNVLGIAGGPVPSRGGYQEEPVSTRLRIRYDGIALKEERELQKRSSRHLRDLVRLGMRYQSLMEEAPKRHLNGFWAGQKTDLPLVLWNQYGGKPEGLEGLMSLYESSHFRNVPAIKIKRDIWRSFSNDGVAGSQRVTGPSDITVFASVLPYTDIMILGPAMTAVARDRLQLDSQFDTEIFSIDEHGPIMGALKHVPRAD
jgi:hypothetical protein